MKNLYGLFEGNVFSKMFMMVAVFMAMSSSLYGGVGDLNASTVGDGNGHLKAVKISFVLNDTTNKIKTDATTFAEFVALFTITNPNLTINGISRNGNGNGYNGSGGTNSIGNYLVADELKEGIGHIYLHFTSSEINTSRMPTISYSASTTKKAWNGSTTASNRSVVATDKAMPVITNVIANMDTPKNIQITFFEAINSDAVITTNNLNTNTLRIITHTSNGDANLSNPTPPAFLNSNGNILTLNMEDEGNFSADNTIKIETSSNTGNLKDRSVATNQFSTNYSTATYTIGDGSNPTLEALYIDLNNSNLENNFTNTESIRLKFSEWVKSTDIVAGRIKICKTTGNCKTLNTKPSINSGDKYYVDINLSNRDANVLKILLAEDGSSSDIKSVIEGGTNIKDYSGNEIALSSSSAIGSIVYKKDTTPPDLQVSFINNVGGTTSNKGKVKLKFNEPVKLSIDESIWNNSPHNFYMMYDKNASGSVETIDSITVSDDKATYELIFNTALEDEGNKTTAIIKAGYAENYSGIDNGDFNKTSLITLVNPPEMNDFNLSISEGKIVVSFTGIGNDDKLFSGNNCKIDIMTFIQQDMNGGSNDNKLTLNPDSNCDIENDKNLSITLNEGNLRKLRVFLGSDTNVSLELNTTDLTNTHEGIVADRKINLRGNSGFVLDGTKPRVDKWKIDLNNKKMKVYFDIPISGDLTSNTFIIAEHNSTGNVTDTFHQWNAIGGDDIDKNETISEGADYNKSVLSIDLNDSFITALLNDVNISTDRHIYLKILGSSGIKNISTNSSSEIDATGSNSIKSEPVAITGGSMNIKFTMRDGVTFPTGYIDTVEIKPDTWYHRSIPAGTTVARDDLLGSNGAFSQVYEYDSAWKTPNTLNSHTGYWIKSKSLEDLNNLDSNLTRATYNHTSGTATNQRENKTQLITRLTRDITTGYKLIGITHGLSASEILGLKTITTCQIFYHHYDINSSKDGLRWDNRSNIQAGEAIWIRRYCP